MAERQPKLWINGSLTPRTPPQQNIQPSPNFGPAEVNSNLLRQYGGNTNTSNFFNDPSSTTSNNTPSGSSSAPPPKRRSAHSSIKSKLLKPALTSHYECHIYPTTDVINWLRQRNMLWDNAAKYSDLVTLSCSEASLPGSSLLTSDVNDNFHGVTERFAYRRQYDDTIDLTFYIDAPKENDDLGYNILWFFEQWISYIVNEQYNADLRGASVDDLNYFYRVRFPASYRNNMFITKFERDVDLAPNGRSGSQKYLEYKFIGAYPTSISSMPVSYDQSQLLKCTVSFTYLRYVVRRKTGISPGDGLPYRKYSFPTILPKQTPSDVPSGLSNSETRFQEAYRNNAANYLIPTNERTLQAPGIPEFNSPSPTPSRTIQPGDATSLA